MTSVMRMSQRAATGSPGGRRRARVLGLGLILAVGLSACVEMPPGAAYEPEVSVGVGFYQPMYPNMIMVPGYPVYYDPYGNANYFFYDGLYWLYQGDRWYSSGWYNGPWTVSGPHFVPYYLLQVPVRYYRAPPPYFRGWRADEPPHWGEHWGRDWEQRHQGWSKRDRRMPPPAPLPKYQGAYAGNRYPRDRDQQDAIRDQNYRYAPRDNMTRSQYPPSGQSSYPQQQQQQQPRQVPAAPGWQQPQSQSPGHQQQQQQQRPPPYQPPHEQDERQQRYPPGPVSPPQNEERSNQPQVSQPPSTTPPQPQSVPDNRQPPPSKPPHTRPTQQHRQSPPPASGQPSHPAPQQPQATSQPDDSSSPPAQGQAKKKSPPPDKGDDREDDRR
jgi:hypothetical protein